MVCKSLTPSQTAEDLHSLAPPSPAMSVLWIHTPFPQERTPTRGCVMTSQFQSCCLSPLHKPAQAAHARALPPALRPSLARSRLPLHARPAAHARLPLSSPAYRFHAARLSPRFRLPLTLPLAAFTLPLSRLRFRPVAYAARLLLPRFRFFAAFTLRPLPLSRFPLCHAFVW